MSRGPGRIERAIEAAFERNPDGYFTVADLARLVYGAEYWERMHRWAPGRKREHAQRVAITRAAAKVAPRMHWLMFRSGRRGGEAIYANGLSLRSYALGRVRAWLGGDGQYRGAMVDGKWTRGAWMDNAERVADRLETDPETAKKIAPGSDWWNAVERNRARASGDVARAQELTEQIKRGEAAQMARFQAMMAAYR
jgi:hypothetical protein